MNKSENNWIAQRLVIIGIGLIGGSLALALRKASAVKQVIGVCQSEATRELALDLGVVDECLTDPVAAVAGADVVVLATPVTTIGSMMELIAPALDQQAVITDVGSVKQFVVKAARASLGEHMARFVPGHPIAGTEQSGVAAAFSGLYQQRSVVLTPTAETTDDALRRVSQMWQLIGAKVQTMSDELHDRILAASSHLPHMVAFGLVNTLGEDSNSSEIFELAAGGFFDFTRIASSDPVMWRDIAISNPEAIYNSLAAFRQRIDKLMQLIDAKDGAALADWFSSAKSFRDQAVRNKNNQSDK